VSRLFVWIGDCEPAPTKLEEIIDPKTGEPKPGWHELTPAEKRLMIDDEDSSGS
jgi:hypothetical protein